MALSTAILMSFDPQLNVTYFKFPHSYNRSYDIALNDASFTMLEMKAMLRHYLQPATTSSPPARPSLPMPFPMWTRIDLVIILIVVLSIVIVLAVILCCRVLRSRTMHRHQQQSKNCLYSIGDYFDDTDYGEFQT